MGYTTRISDYEMDRAWTKGPEVEGVDVEESKDDRVSTTRAKQVEPEKKTAPKKSTAKTTTKDAKS